MSSSRCPKCGGRGCGAMCSDETDRSTGRWDPLGWATACAALSVARSSSRTSSSQPCGRTSQSHIRRNSSDVRLHTSLQRTVNNTLVSALRDPRTGARKSTSILTTLAPVGNTAQVQNTGRICFFSFLREAAGFPTPRSPTLRESSLPASESSCDSSCRARACVALLFLSRTHTHTLARSLIPGSPRQRTANTDGPLATPKQPTRPIGANTAGRQQNYGDGDGGKTAYGDTTTQPTTAHARNATPNKRSVIAQVLRRVRGSCHHVHDDTFSGFPLASLIG